MQTRSLVLSGSGATLLLIGAMSLFAAEPAGNTGELWEVTSKMSMEGMPMEMPAQTMRVCSAKEWTEPPPGGPGECKTSDFKRNGNKISWTTTCSGPPAMTGVGEITRDGDAYTGAIRFSSDEANMIVKLNGRRVGSCTPK